MFDMFGFSPEPLYVEGTRQCLPALVQLEKPHHKNEKPKSLDHQSKSSKISLAVKSSSRKPKKTKLPYVIGSGSAFEDRENHLFKLCDKMNAGDLDQDELLRLCEKSARSISFTPATPPPRDYRKLNEIFEQCLFEIVELNFQKIIRKILIVSNVEMKMVLKITLT